MITAATHTGQLIIYVADEPIDETTIAFVKDEVPGATILADLLEPLYEDSISTRDASHFLGRLKLELETMIEKGALVAIVCRRHSNNLGTRAHFLASLCASADRVHFLSST